MPMQPRPMAETSGPLAPNLRVFMVGWMPLSASTYMVGPDRRQGPPGQRACASSLILGIEDSLHGFRVVRTHVASCAGRGAHRLRGRGHSNWSRVVPELGRT